MPLQSIINSLSQRRLSTYKNDNLCDTSDPQSLGLYLWNKQLSGLFFPVLQILEVSLRNAIHTAYIKAKLKEIAIHTPELSQQNKLKEEQQLWFTKIYTRKNNPTGYHQVSTATDNIKKENKSLSADNYIAKLTFGFWVNMTNKNHRQSNDENQPPIITLWPKLTTEVFPNAKDKTGKHLSINHISDELHSINKLRNRIAHHEPIWKITEIFDINDAINHIVRQYDLCLSVIKWINVDNLALISIIENDKMMSQACNPHTIWKNKHLPTGLTDIPSLDNWYDNHIIDTRRSGTVIHSTTQMAIIKCTTTNTKFYTNKKMLKHKNAWPLAQNTKVTFIPKPPDQKNAKLSQATQLLVQPPN